MKYLKKILDGIGFLFMEASAVSCAVIGYLIGMGIALLLKHSGSESETPVAGIVIIVCGISLKVYGEIYKYRKHK